MMCSRYVAVFLLFLAIQAIVLLDVSIRLAKEPWLKIAWGGVFAPSAIYVAGLIVFDVANTIAMFVQGRTLIKRNMRLNR